MDYKISFVDVRQTLSDHVHRVHYSHDRCLITKWGKSMVAMISIDEYFQLIDFKDKQEKFEKEKAEQAAEETKSKETDQQEL